MRRIKINDKGVKSALKDFKIDKHSTPQAICEYIWNAYDASATNIEIVFEKNELERVIDIKIIDNGTGIHYEEVDEKFGFLLQSQKLNDESERRIDSNTHGKRGIGRLTFEYFASNAVWKTNYSDSNDKTFFYEISMASDSIDAYKIGELIESNNEPGTEVHLSVKDDISINIPKTLNYIKQQFCWLLELKENLNIFITIDGERNLIDYSDLVHDSKTLQKEIGNSTFNIKLIIWNEKIGDENSKYYFIDSNYIEKLKTLTKFNRKGDGFRHSLFVQSDYFNNLNFSSFSNIPADRPLYVTNCVTDDKFKSLMEVLKSILKDERKRFLRISAKKNVIEKYEKRNYLPKYNKNPLGEYMKKTLIETIEEIYIFEPTLFNNLNKAQSKTIVRLIDLIITSDNPESLFNILDEVISLKEEERNELSSVLNKTKLSNIVSTIKLIDDRRHTIELLKKLVFDNKKETLEVPHLQEIVENHFWIFGEQYKLLASAEDKFKTLLKNYWIETTGEELSDEEAKTSVDYEFKNREVDLFLCRQEKTHDKIHNVIVELKRPSIKLGRKEYRQVEDYVEQIQKIDRFNADNYEWTFILVGNEFKDDGVVERELENAKVHGEKYLVKKFGNYKVYVKKWSEIFNEFDIKHNFLLEKLKIEEGKLLEPDNYKPSDDMVEESLKNSAVV